MKYHYTYTLNSRIQYDNSYQWYLERSEIAADNFRIAISMRIEQICEQPKQFRNTKKKFREAILKKFPFSIIYIVDEANQSIIITSVFHHKQHPKQKYKR